MHQAENHANSTRQFQLTSPTRLYVDCCGTSMLAVSTLTRAVFKSGMDCADRKYLDGFGETRLVAAKVRVAHEVERELVHAGCGWRGKVELGTLAALQGHALDGQQRVGLGLAHHQPPVLFLAPRVPACGAQNRDILDK